MDSSLNQFILRLQKEAEDNLAQSEGFEVTNLKDVEDIEELESEKSYGLKESQRKKQENRKNITGKFRINLVLRISILFVIVIAYFVYSYIAIFVLNDDVKKQGATLLEVEGDRATEFRLAVYWSNRYAYKLTDSTANISSAYHAFRNEQQYLMYGNSSKGLSASQAINGNQQALTLDNGCPSKLDIPAGRALTTPLATYTFDICIQYDSNIFQTGLQAAISQAYINFQSLEKELQNNTASNQQATGKSAYTTALTSSLFQSLITGESIFYQQSLAVSNTNYHEQLMDEVEGDQKLLLILMLVYIGLAIIIYCFVYIPLIKQVSLELSRTRQMIFMIPPSLMRDLDQSPDFHKQFKTIFKNEMKA